jgi:hypothetical protein
MVMHNMTVMSRMTNLANRLAMHNMAAMSRMTHMVNRSNREMMKDLRLPRIQMRWGEQASFITHKVHVYRRRLIGHASGGTARIDGMVQVLWVVLVLGIVMMPMLLQEGTTVW